MQVDVYASMDKSLSGGTSEKAGPSAFLRAFRGQTVPIRDFMDRLRSVVPHSQALMTAAVPRGGLHIVQPERFPEALLRKYAREAEGYDRLSWTAITQNGPVVSTDLWSAAEGSRDPFLSEFVGAFGSGQAAAVPLASPVFEGYPGALHVYRRASEAAFNPTELAVLSEAGRELSTALAQARKARLDAAEPGIRANQPLPARMFVVDRNLRCLLPGADPAQQDPELYRRLLEEARRCFEQVNGVAVNDRVPISDSRGVLWNFRIVVYPRYPALSETPVGFLCLQPDCSQWSILRASDLEADEEMSRLIPAIRFLLEQYQRVPNLTEVARAVHLSPFHFHRRFTELLGITPKHLLLDCQIQRARKDLLNQAKTLADIAMACGFSHQSHFSSRFKQATGLTPTRWRKMALEAAAIGE